MRSNSLSQYSICFLFLMIGFLGILSPYSAKAQSVTMKCEWAWKWVWVWENEYNPVTRNTELHYVYRYRYVQDCVPTVTETRTIPLAPSGEIDQMWVDYDVHDKDIHGMRIHLKFNVSNLKDKKCSANVYFYYASGKPLKDSNGKFKTTDGNVAVHKDFIPTYVGSVYKDFQLFMPYDELDMATGNYSLKFDAQIHCSAVSFVATSKDHAFDYSRPK